MAFKAILLPFSLTLLGLFAFLLAGPILSFILIPLICLGILDCKERWMDYHEIKRRLSHGESLKIHKEYRYSRCRRNACKSAFLDFGGVGYYYSVKKSFHQMGYRWYHLFPDKTFSSKSPFLDKDFYKLMIFGKERK